MVTWLDSFIMTDTRFLRLNDVYAYKTSFSLSNYVWDIVIEWDYFSRNTVGTQFVKAIDSVSANIAEGFGRYTKKDKIHFYRYSFGSVKESLDWNEKARMRKLLTNAQYKHIFEQLDLLPRQINGLIKLTNTTLTI